MTEHHGVAVPTLPSPRATMPSPAPSRPVAAPLGVPTLPAAGTTPVPPADTLAADRPEPPAGRPARDVPAWKQRQNSKGRKVARLVTKLAVLGVIGAGGFVVYQQVTSSGDDSTDETPDQVVTDDPAAGATGVPAGAGALPAVADVAATPAAPSDFGIIDDARDLVAEIDDNGEELLALEQLGLTPDEAFAGSTTARVITAADIAAGTESVAGAPNYAFTWSYPSGSTITTWIDTTTGDFQMSTATNLVLRSVDGRLYEQTGPGRPWSLSPLQEFAERAFVGRDGVITAPAILPTEMFEFAILAEADADGFGSYLIDDVAFAARHPELRAEFLTMWGFDGTTAPSAPSADALVDGLPDVAGPGQLLVHTDGGRSAVVTTATVATPAGSSTYILLEASPDPRPITPPELG